ncbi:DMT family transporter [Spirillospora sp. CA-255316]
MRNHDSATTPASIAELDAHAPGQGAGLGLAGLGVLVFSLTVPATVFALEGLDPYLIGIGRSAAATVLAAIALLTVHLRSRSRSRAAAGPQEAVVRPRGRQWAGVAVTAAGVVFGFPVLSTLALDHGASSAHAAVVIGLLPAATAVLAVLRAGERPSAAFWLAGAAGAVVVTGFAVIRGAGHLTPADLLLFGALLSAAAGYAEGGLLTREMPGWRVISWALLLSAPITVPVTVWLLAATGPQWTGRAALGFGYVALLSAYLGFFAWYEGLARAGIARASQVQLAQPLLTLLWSGILLGELIDGLTALAAVGVLVCVALAQRARVRHAPRPARRGRGELAERDTRPHDGKESVTTM